MGWGYLQFRAFYEFQRKSGLLKKKFPINISDTKFISLEEWKKNNSIFFFSDRSEINFPKKKYSPLLEYYTNFIEGKLPYFSSEIFNIGKEYDWISNPQSGYKYEIYKHWTEIDDLSIDAGDIKYVWEKSRFSYLYNLIRYDYHFEQDLAKLIIDEILSWIKANPLNLGPNYKCSQEISIRLLNWTFALNYYKNSKYLTNDTFHKILNSIYWQARHIYSNIQFSRKSVRNNHAITETLALYLIGLLYPFFPESNKWKSKGKNWFEEEILYQVYEDGSYLQFSMNYHRVVIQLLTWAFYLAKLNNEKFSEAVYQRGQKTLHFLLNAQDHFSGRLPNYGSNDGALFFKLNESHYRDYRPQLNALYYFYYEQNLYPGQDYLEDTLWYNRNFKDSHKPVYAPSLSSHDIGGFYNIRDKDSLTFIRCGIHKDRPAHADNLHVDIWYNGENIFHDSGTFQYNTEKELLSFFNGTSAHNTVQLAQNDQMLKGPRFIWLNWSQADYANLKETDEEYYFEGSIRAFGYLSNNVSHKRTVKKHKNKPVWIIEDFIDHNLNLPIIQNWNTKEEFQKKFSIEAFDADNKIILPDIKPAWYSSFYGVKEKSINISFSAASNRIRTIIKMK